MFFEMEIVKLGNQIMVGIASDAQRRAERCRNNPGFLAYYLGKRAARLICPGKAIKTTTAVVPQDGWKILVTVDRKANEVKWILMHPFRI